MNVCQLSPAQKNNLGPPQGFQRGLHSGGELVLSEIDSEGNYIISPRNTDKLRLKCWLSWEKQTHWYIDPETPRWVHKVNLPFIVSGAAPRFSLDDGADKSLSCLPLTEGAAMPLEIPLSSVVCKIIHPTNTVQIWRKHWTFVVKIASNDSV